MRLSLLLPLGMILLYGLTEPVESKLRRQKPISSPRIRGLQGDTTLESYFSICLLTAGTGNVDLNLAAQTLVTTYNNLATSSYSDPLERRMATVEVLEVEGRRELSKDEIRKLQYTQMQNLNVFLRVTGTCRGCASRTRFTNQAQRRRRLQKASSKSGKGKGSGSASLSTKGKGGDPKVESDTITGRYNGTVDTVPIFNGYPDNSAPIQQPPGSGQPVYNTSPSPVSSGTLMPADSTMTPSLVGSATSFPIPPLAGTPTWAPIPPLAGTATSAPTPLLAGTATSAPIPPLAGIPTCAPIPPLPGTATSAPIPPLAGTDMPTSVPPLGAMVTPMPTPSPVASSTPIPTAMERGDQQSVTGGQSSNPPFFLESPSSAPSAAPSGQPSSTPSLLPSTQPSLAPSSLPSMLPSVAPSSLPSVQPSLAPSSLPSMLPSVAPSSLPSVQPSSTPSALASNPSSPPIYLTDGQAVSDGSTSGVVDPVQTAVPSVAAVPTEEELRTAFAQAIRLVDCHILDVTHLEEVNP